jgi:hypothetical protein
MIVEPVMWNKVAYWICCALACVCGVVSYDSQKLYESGLYVEDIELIAAALWVVCFFGTVHFAKRIGWGRWWVAVTGPFALFYAIEGLVMMLFWTLFGFAP